MPRKSNKIETVEIKLSTTSPVAIHLDHLVNTGLYGKTRAEAAERLVTRGIEKLIIEGTLSESP